MKGLVGQIVDGVGVIYRMSCDCGGPYCHYVLESTSQPTNASVYVRKCRKIRTPIEAVGEIPEDLWK